MADLWEGHVHEQGFMRPHLCLRHDLHLKQVGGGLDILLTNKMLTPNASLHSRLAKQLRDVCDAQRHTSLVVITNCLYVNELFASHQAKQITEFGLGVAKTYSILDQPGMPDEAVLLLAQHLMK